MTYYVHLSLKAKQGIKHINELFFVNSTISIKICLLKFKATLLLIFYLLNKFSRCCRTSNFSRNFFRSLRKM